MTRKVTSRGIQINKIPNETPRAQWHSLPEVPKEKREKKRRREKSGKPASVDQDSKL
jgi:hypothetical protein